MKKIKKTVKIILFSAVLCLILFLLYRHFIYHESWIHAYIPVDDKNVVIIECFENENTEDGYTIIKRVNFDQGEIWSKKRDEVYFYLNVPLNVRFNHDAVINDTFTFGFHKENCNIIFTQFDLNTGNINWESKLACLVDIDYLSFSDGKNIYIEYQFSNKVIAVELESGDIVWEIETPFSNHYEFPILSDTYLIYTQSKNIYFIHKETGQITELNWDINNYDYEAVIGNKFYYSVQYEDEREVFSIDLADFLVKSFMSDESLVRIAFYKGNLLLIYSYGIKSVSLESDNPGWEIFWEDDFVFEDYNYSLVYPEYRMYANPETRYLPFYVRHETDSENIYALKLVILDLENGEIIQEGKEQTIYSQSYYAPSENVIYDNNGKYFIEVCLPDNKWGIMIINGHSGKPESAFQFFYAGKNNKEYEYFDNGFWQVSSFSPDCIKNNVIFFRFKRNIYMFDLEKEEFINNRPDPGKFYYMDCKDLVAQELGFVFFK
jgi:outer membrane protein assembly factor BamB